MTTDETPLEGMNDIHTGDCLDALWVLPDTSVDLIVTSPPYADARKSTYGGIHPDAYVDWFLPRAAQFKRVLKPTGSFILNIKEKVVKGERHTYVMELVFALRQQGWLWTEEYIWHKKNACPGKWVNRFRDAWESCFHFTKERKFAMYQEAVMVPSRMTTIDHSRLRPQDEFREASATGAPFGRRRAAWKDRKMAFPDNVLYFAPQYTNVGHPAAFPEALPAFFINLFTQEGDVVLDPFLGSGTVAVVAKRLNRQWVGVEKMPEYVELAKKRIAH